MKYLTLIMILVICLVGCGGGGGGGGFGDSPSLGGVFTPIVDGISGTYCKAYTTVGVSEATLQDAVMFLDSIAAAEQALLGNCDRVTIIFDGCETGYYDGQIHVSADEEPLHRRLCHEYAHHIHRSNHDDVVWIYEVVAKGAEVHFGLWNPPETCVFENLETEIDYTSQCHFANYLMKTYGDGILYNIIHSGSSGRGSIEAATGEDFDTILERWKNG